MATIGDCSFTPSKDEKIAYGKWKRIVKFDHKQNRRKLDYTAKLSTFVTAQCSHERWCLCDMCVIDFERGISGLTANDAVKLLTHRDDWVKDLTEYGVEPNPGPRAQGGALGKPKQQNPSQQKKQWVAKKAADPSDKKKKQQKQGSRTSKNISNIATSLAKADAELKGREDAVADMAAEVRELKEEIKIAIEGAGVGPFSDDGVEEPPSENDPEPPELRIASYEQQKYDDRVNFKLSCGKYKTMRTDLMAAIVYAIVAKANYKLLEFVLNKFILGRTTLGNMPYADVIKTFFLHRRINFFSKIENFLGYYVKIFRFLAVLKMTQMFVKIGTRALMTYQGKRDHQWVYNSDGPVVDNNVDSRTLTQKYAKLGEKNPILINVDYYDHDRSIFGYHGPLTKVWNAIAGDLEPTHVKQLVSVELYSQVNTADAVTMIRGDPISDKARIAFRARGIHGVNIDRHIGDDQDHYIVQDTAGMIYGKWSRYQEDRATNPFHRLAI